MVDDPKSRDPYGVPEGSVKRDLERREVASERQERQRKGRREEPPPEAREAQRVEPAPLMAMRWLAAGEAVGPHLTPPVAQTFGEHLWLLVDQLQLAELLADNPLGRKALADALEMAARACRAGRPPFRV